MDSRRRVVITGIGLITPIGNDLEATWSGLMAGRSGAAPTTLFDTTNFATKFSCEVKGWNPASFFDKRELKHLDRFLQFGVAAGVTAVADAGLGPRLPEAEADRWGVYIGAGLGGVQTIQDTYAAQAAKGPRHGFSPYFVTDIIINEIPGMISIRTGATGPNMSHVSACSTGAHSIGEAARAIERGDVDAMLAGGTEAPVTRIGVASFAAMRALSTQNEDPTRASRPFDRARDGFVMAEGSAVLLLEAEEHARARGAPIRGRLLGYAGTADAAHIAQPTENAEGAQRCMRLAIEDADLSLSDVGYVNAHATSTPAGDPSEARAIRAVFGAHADRLPVSATKSMTGHMLGAAGAVEAMFCIRALETGILPPTINLESPDDDCELDHIVNEARRAPIRVALSNSFGFGGTNATLVFQRYAG